MTRERALRVSTTSINYVASNAGERCKILVQSVSISGVEYVTKTSTVYTPLLLHYRGFSCLFVVFIRISTGNKLTKNVQSFCVQNDNFLFTCKIVRILNKIPYVLKVLNPGGIVTYLHTCAAGKSNAID